MAAHPTTVDLTVSVNLALPASEYHEDMGAVLWWVFPINEPPYVGGPKDIGYPVQVSIQTYGSEEKRVTVYSGGWPGYHTHFTPIIPPTEPASVE